MEAGDGWPAVRGAGAGDAYFARQAAHVHLPVRPRQRPDVFGATGLAEGDRRRGRSSDEQQRIFLGDASQHRGK